MILILACAVYIYVDICAYRMHLVRRTRHAGHCLRSKGELISDVLLWNPSYGGSSVKRARRTYLQQLCTH